MADRPILFSAPMVRTLLDGTKRQMRRGAKAPAIMGCKVATTSPDESLIELDDGEFQRGIFRYASTGRLAVHIAYRSLPATAHEIKISRADFKRETHGKQREARLFSDRFRQLRAQ